MKFKKGDEVIITIGKDKGKKGKIEKIITNKNSVVVSGINLYKRHTKPQGKNKGGIIDIIKPLNTAKIALVCPKCKQATRIGYEFEGEEKNRVCKKCKNLI